MPMDWRKALDFPQLFPAFHTLTQGQHITVSFSSCYFLPRRVWLVTTVLLQPASQRRSSQSGSNSGREYSDAGGERKGSLKLFPISYLPSTPCPYAMLRLCSCSSLLIHSLGKYRRYIRTAHIHIRHRTHSDAFSIPFSLNQHLLAQQDKKKRKKLDLENSLLFL